MVSHCLCPRKAGFGHARAKSTSNVHGHSWIESASKDLLFQLSANTLPGNARSGEKCFAWGHPACPSRNNIKLRGSQPTCAAMVWANIMLSSYIISWAGNGIWKIYCAQSTSELNTLNTNQPGLGARRCRTPAATSISKFSGQVKFPI